MSTLIFGYGSLINVDNLFKTIGRKLSRSEFRQANLHGYKRVWNYKARVHIENMDKEINAVYLNIAESKGNSINGVVFEVNDFELEKLNIRERYYSLIDITNCISPVPKNTVFTYICCELEHIAEDNSDFFIMQKYIDIVNEGCESLGIDFWDEFKRTTEKKKFEILEGNYSFI